MKPQNYEKKNREIHDAFAALTQQHPEKLQQRLKLSWSNWGFGVESLAMTARRLNRNSVEYIELHGNHYGPDLGYKPKETLAILGDQGIEVAGVCGMFSSDNDLSSNRAIHRQAAIDYIRRELDFAHAVGATYLLVVPSAVGHPQAYDGSEFERSAETLAGIGDLFTAARVRAAIEPIRSAEVSLIHTITDAKRYIAAVNHPAIRHINGDLYHMLTEETHIGAAILEAGKMLINLHAADTNRRALGEGMLDLDTALKALWLIGYGEGDRFVTPEPLGPGGDPYPAMHGRTASEILDRLVAQTIGYFRERETALREASPAPQQTGTPHEKNKQ